MTSSFSNTPSEFAAWDILTRGYDVDETLPVWIDCDPGHDDAFALVLALHHPRLRVLGVSTVDGNAPLRCTTRNALRMVTACGVRDERVYAGASAPLLRYCTEAGMTTDGMDGGDAYRDENGMEVGEVPRRRRRRHSARIHGDGGMDLLGMDSPWPSEDYGAECLGEQPAVEAMAHIIAAEYARLNVPAARERAHATDTAGCRNHVMQVVFGDAGDTAALPSVPPPRKVKIVACGPLTNIALLLSVYEHLVPMVDVVVLGGALVAPGNVTPLAEFNVHHDPEAFALVIHAGIQHVVLVPLEVTHTVVADERIVQRWAGLHSTFGDVMAALVRFYNERYRHTYGMAAACLHDPVAVAAVFGIALGKYRVSHECVRVETMPRTMCRGKVVVVDRWRGATPNVYVARAVDTEWFWAELLGAVQRADAVSPLNVGRMEKAEGGIDAERDEERR